MTNREIDALVQNTFFPWDEARCRVCGWRRIDVDSREAAFASVGCRIEDCSERPRPATRADSTAHFSTDPAASKALRDKMWADGWSYEINASKREGIWVSFSHPGTVEDFTTYGDTEELAAALAALKTQGVEVPA